MTDQQQPEQQQQPDQQPPPIAAATVHGWFPEDLTAVALEAEADLRKRLQNAGLYYAVNAALLNLRRVLVANMEVIHNTGPIPEYGEGLARPTSASMPKRKPRQS